MFLGVGAVCWLVGVLGGLKVGSPPVGHHLLEARSHDSRIMNWQHLKVDGLESGGVNNLVDLPVSCAY